jgi:hypothetical protein
MAMAIITKAVLMPSLLMRRNGWILILMESVTMLIPTMMEMVFWMVVISGLWIIDIQQI